MESVTDLSGDSISQPQFHLSLRLKCLRQIQSIVIDGGNAKSSYEEMMRQQSLINAIFDLVDLNSCKGGRHSKLIQKDTTEPGEVVRDYFQNNLRQAEKRWTKDEFTQLWTNADFQRLMTQYIDENFSDDLRRVTEMLIWIVNPRRISMELRSRLDHIYHGLCQVEDPSVGITLEGLRSILTAKHPWLVDRLFARLKKEWNIANLRAEDVHLIFLHILGQEPDTKTFFLFSLFDESGGGKLTCTDLKQVLSDCMQDNGVAFEEEEQRQMVKVLIQECLGVKGVDKVCYSGVTIEYKDILNLLSHESDLAPTIAL
ncbi:hypothetical protein TCAL_15170, partial [Tigriopus californicus]